MKQIKIVVTIKQVTKTMNEVLVVKKQGSEKTAILKWVVQKGDFFENIGNYSLDRLVAMEASK